jgi:hypothetical protein
MAMAYALKNCPTKKKNKKKKKKKKKKRKKTTLTYLRRVVLNPADRIPIHPL